MPSPDPPDSNVQSSTSPPVSNATTLISHTDARAPPHSAYQLGDHVGSLRISKSENVTASEPWSTASSATVLGEQLNPGQRRVLQLKRDMRRAGAGLPQHANKGLFQEAYSTDLMFLMDTTNSMRPYIDAARDQVKALIKEINAAFYGEAEIRMAVVSYTDHNCTSNIKFLDFTTSVDQVHSFLDRLKTQWGDDLAEDVLGGMNQALNATWKHRTRCMIHIGDAPPHGTKYRDRNLKDNFPKAGSEPHGLTLEPLVDRMIRLNINYALLRISPDTDRMASVIHGKYAALSAGCKLHPRNQHFSKISPMSRDPKMSASSAPLFEEQELGTTFAALQHLVFRSVTQSASRSAVRMISSASKSGKLDTGTKFTTALAAVDEEKDHGLQMETKKPQWNSRSWLDETLTVEGFSPDLAGDSPITLDEMLENEDNIKIDAVELLVHKRSRPFAQGATRLAFYARAQTMTDRFVVKSYKREGKPFAHFAKDMQCQALCKAFALEFNSLLGQQTMFDFVITTCLKGKYSSTDLSDQECLSLEPFLEGTYTKYNNNCGYINEELPQDPFNQAAQAFSHFTFERSQGRFLVCDIQGVGGLLTDAAIHTLDPDRFKLGSGNFGPDGFKFFFATHACNGVCARLGLKSTAATLATGRYHDFRRAWPAPDPRFRCCSNRLCGRITRLPDAYDLATPRRYHWCHTCFQQMRSSFERVVCVAVPKPRHDFAVSRFLCESQGLPMPGACPEHRGLDVEMSEKSENIDRTSTAGGQRRRSSVATEGGGLWSRVRTARKKLRSGSQTTLVN